MDAPREDLIRMSTELRHDESGNRLVGYAAVWDSWTEINSWEGHFRERFRRGAFRKTLRENGSRIKVLFNHGMDPQIGDKPLGKPEVIREDDKGLYIEVPLDDTSYNRDIKALLRSGALDGMSFRWSAKRDDWEKLDTQLPERTVHEAKLYELGPVTFPAYEATEAGVRAHAPRAFEAWRQAQPSPEPIVPTPAESDEPERSDDPATTATASEESPEGHPEEDRQDAPPEGHPSDDATDAPPDAGHPSRTHRRQPPERLAAKFASVEALGAISDERYAQHEPSVRRHMAAEKEAS